MARALTGKTGNLTVFGPETEFVGKLEFTDNLIITGKFDGTIKAQGSLEIDKSATCIVDEMSAKSIMISGSVTGNVLASEKVEMRSGSKIIGDVVTKRLRIADDVDFQGQVSMLDEEPSANIFSVDSAEYKQNLTLK